MPTTYVLMVTDMSGSMSSNAVAVRSGFNEYIASLTAPEGKMKFKVSAYTFNTEMNELAEQLDPERVPKLDHDNYHPDGMTALLDSVAKAVMHLEDTVTLKKRDKVLVVIQTDGEENSSREWEFNRLAAKLKELEAGGQWGFLYVGAGVDAWANGYRLGISSARSSNTPNAHRSTYDSLSVGTRQYAGGQSTNSVADWMEEEHVKAGTGPAQADDAISDIKAGKGVRRARPTRKPDTDSDDVG